MRLYEFSCDLYVSGHPKERDVPKLLEAGITEIVCVSKKITPDEVLRQTGAKLTYLPLPDGKTLPENELSLVVSYVVRYLENEETVLVHCLQGRNRSMLVAALAGKEIEHWSGEEAFQHARWLRPSCLHNPVFERRLRGS